jgi:hypothetical protein
MTLLILLYNKSVVGDKSTIFSRKEHFINNITIKEQRNRSFLPNAIDL